MENASKALLMAAGILIGLIIASLFTYEMISMSETGRTFQKQIDQSVITEFNTNFEKYVGKNLTAQEVVTIYNYVQEWNKDNAVAFITLDTNIQALKDLQNNRVNATIEDFLNDNWNKDDNKYFTLIINGYGEDGRINKITIKNKNI